MAGALTQRGDASRSPPPGARVILVTGVSGSGKSEVARLLHVRLGIAFLDADDFHSAANVAKMGRGEPLDDADRQGWLIAVRGAIDDTLARGDSAAVACSALKEAYRRRLGVGRPEIALVYLKADPEIIRQRLKNRVGHFMKASMLESQLAALEEPHDAVVVDATGNLDNMVDTIVAAIGWFAP